MLHYSTGFLFTKKIALVSVINDLVSDNRVKKTCAVLQDCGYHVVLIGRRFPESPPITNMPYVTERMRLLFRKGPAMYLSFTCRLFFKLLFKRAHLLVANDLDTLAPNYLIGRLRRIPLIYDNHELFWEVPELMHSPVKRALWRKMEASIVPRLQHAITVNDSIAGILQARYGTRFAVVRNIPDAEPGFACKDRVEMRLPADKKLLLLQGAGINVDRGAEELVAAMQWVENAVLYIIGGGDCWEQLKHLITRLNLASKVVMIDRLPKRELMQYTCNADLGISIDKNSNPNYFNSLPNKVFDYLHAGVPILASRLPEIEHIVTRYEVGEFIDHHDPEHIAAAINGLLQSDRLAGYKANTRRASAELSWQNEKTVLKKVILDAGGR